ncbi:MAG: hypothetical protein ACOYON_01675 [Fimbriimonas sp.]
MLDQLDAVAPGVPLLALGQTVFWDEPMKAGVAHALTKRGDARRFVAGVHDTDYFAKVAGERHRPGQFRTLKHNDTTTRGFWSAAGEFSALFGSETVITKDALLTAGLKLDRIRPMQPNFLDEATEAWGWRGIASLDEHPPITAEVSVRSIFPELSSAFDWALDTSLEFLSGEGRRDAQLIADGLRTRLCEAREVSSNVSELYKHLIPAFYACGYGRPIDLDVTATTDLLKFNSSTASLTRFRIVDLFVRQSSRSLAVAAYDEAIKGSGLYGLSRFGTGAIPFDLVIPGRGRGTVRVGNRGIVIQTPTPQFISLKKPLADVEEFAALVEAKFGPDCTLVGKAVALIGMLASEFVFVFHEGASSYVKHSRTFHQLLNERLPAGSLPKIHPIFRLRYETWDALRVACSWLNLPVPLQRPFGTEELCAPSFAARWRDVGQKQSELLDHLGTLRRPIDLIEFLSQELGGSWRNVADEYRSLFGDLQTLNGEIAAMRAKRHDLVQRRRSLKAERVRAEVAKGNHFRATIFEKNPSNDDLMERQRLSRKVKETIEQIHHTEAEIQAMRQRQRERVHEESIQKLHERRRHLEIEAELKRSRLIRQAIITHRGLRNANYRPSIWWFPLVSPDGLWFRETIDTAQCYLEELQ